MSCAIRPRADSATFIATVDGFATEFGLASYSDLVRENERLKGLASLRLAHLLAMTADAAAVAVNLELNTEATIDEAHEIATAAAVRGNEAIKADERRADLADAARNIAVLAAHRDRLRAAGRRA